MKNKSICVLVSGGLDSCALLAEATQNYRNVWPLYIQEGLVWEKAEIYWLKKFIRKLAHTTLKPLHVLQVPMKDVYEHHWSTGGRDVPGAHTKDEAVYLPGRNILLTAKAAVFASIKKIPQITLASLHRNPFPDATPGFFDQWGKALSVGLASPIFITAPYHRLSKGEVIKRAKKWPLHLSFSCLAPRGLKHCGRCNKCAERKKGFREAGEPDLTLYAQR